jgi:hypothetical protein
MTKKFFYTILFSGCLEEYFSQDKELKRKTAPLGINLVGSPKVINSSPSFCCKVSNSFLWLGCTFFEEQRERVMHLASSGSLFTILLPTGV